MRRFKLNKLVRDEVFTNMQELGQEVDFRRLENDELLKALKDKLIEEAAELDPSNPKALEELTDILEVVEQTAEVLGVDFDNLRAAQLAKRKKAGGFAGRVFVANVNLQDDDPWVEYYADNSERFPEIK